MFGVVLQALFGIALGLGIIAFAVYVSVDLSHRYSRAMVILSMIFFTIPISLFGAFLSRAALQAAITLWRDRRTPLPAIDGTPIVIARTRPRLIWRTLGQAYCIMITALFAAANAKEMEPLQFGFVALMILSWLLGILQNWFPPRLRWQSIVLDSEGIEDRSTGIGKVPWRDVLNVSMGAQGAPNGVLIKLAEAPRRLPGQGLLATGITPILDRLFQGRRHLVIRSHGLDFHTERTFRLIDAYWRYATSGGHARNESPVRRLRS